MFAQRRSSGPEAQKKYDSKPSSQFKPGEFESVLLETIKICRKNLKLRSRSKNLRSEYEKSEDFHMHPMESTKRNNVLNPRMEIPHGPIHEQIEESSEFQLEKFSTILWFTLSPSSRKNMLPESQFLEFSKTKKENNKNASNSDEDLFNIGKMFCNEGNFTQSVNYFNKAKNLAPRVEKYKLWKSMAMIKLVNEYPKNNESNSSICCSSRNNLSKRDYLMKIVNKLVIQSQNIEINWCLMEISLLDGLIVGQEIEPSRFYAARIKHLDNFYGLLAWVQIYLKESNPDTQSLLLELISTFPDRPEPYYIAWSYFFSKKKYDRSKEVAIEAFLKITSEEFEHFYIIFCLNLAKSYYYCGEFTNCIELLHKKYLENPKYPVFLYTLCKYCVLSEDFSFSGIAKGNLKEMLRLCSDSRKGSIYYYLCKSYWLTRQFPQAFMYAFKASRFLSAKKNDKKLEIEKKMVELQPFVKKIQEIQEKIQNKKAGEQELRECEGIRDFHKPSADLLIAEIFYSRGEKNEAISLLKTMISTSRLETSAFFKLIIFDQLNTENVFKALLARAKNNQIPTQVWVKANLLYAKFMFKSSHYNKCFYVLRVLVKMLPPLPDLSLPYCTSLQNSENLQELANAFTSIVQDPSPRSNQAFLNIRDLTLKISEDAPLPKNPATKRQKLFGGQPMKVFNSVAIEVNSNDSSDEDKIRSPHSSEISNFCVCSKPKFLYYIAKFSSRIGRNKQEGLFAIKDYIELLKLEKKVEKQQILLKKAQKVQMALSSMDS